MPIVRLPRNLVSQVLRHAQCHAHVEVCGLISARDGRAVGCYPVRNIARNPRRYFRMDPREQIDAMRMMRERDESLFAIYHSHPGSPAAPSEEDLKEAGYPDAVYLIVSLHGADTPELRAWRLHGTGCEELELWIL
jgi:proteasome lid subunit RPN8/RPN11